MEGQEDDILETVGFDGFDRGLQGFYRVKGRRNEKIKKSTLMVLEKMKENQG